MPQKKPATNLCAAWVLLQERKSKKDSPGGFRMGFDQTEVSDAVRLIQHFESCMFPIGGGSFTSYPDPAHGWRIPTVGWGTTHYENGRRVKRGDVISQDRADELLAWEVREKASAVVKSVNVPMSQNQFEAMVSFAYNVGATGFKRSRVATLLNSGDYQGAADALLERPPPSESVRIGLLRRRTSERNLFLGERDYIVTFSDFVS